MYAQTLPRICLTTHVFHNQGDSADSELKSTLVRRSLLISKEYFVTIQQRPREKSEISTRAGRTAAAVATAFEFSSTLGEGRAISQIDFDHELILGFGV